MRPICTKCQCVMLCQKNGCEIKVGGKVYSGDVYRCPECGFDVATGFGRGQTITPDNNLHVDMEAHHGG